MSANLVSNLLWRHRADRDADTENDVTEKRHSLMLEEDSLLSGKKFLVLLVREFRGN